MGKHDASVAAVDGAVERGCSWIEGMVVEWCVGLLQLV